MPTFSRATLRQLLTTDYLRDGLVGNLTASWGVASVNLIDTTQADLSMSGQNLYARSWVRHNGATYRVASFNTGTGCFVTLQSAPTTVVSGGAYEVHFSLPPEDKDRALNDAVKRVRVRREVGLSSVDGLHSYTLDGCASPNTVLDVLDAYYFANPSDSLTRDQRSLSEFQVVTTATGRELRISPALGQSVQLVLDCVLTLTLGAADTATINVPDDRWLLSGAAAKAYDLLIRKAPGQNRGELVKDRAEFAAAWTRLSTRFQPVVDRPMAGVLDEPFEATEAF